MKLLENIVVVNGCHIWQRAKNKKGYGLLKVGNKTMLAHRLSYELKNGEIPQGILVLHTCDNTSCVNPDHLFLGTARDNWEDSKMKGRSTQQKQSDKTKHGTRSMYHNGCRCESCRTAENTYQKKRRFPLRHIEGLNR